MSFDVGDLFGNLFGGGPAVVAALVSVVAPPGGGQVAPVIVVPADSSGDPLVAPLFADWICRPDCHGRMGWESPGLPEWQRWWARCDFDDLPVVPEGFSMGELPKTTPQDAHCCVSGGTVDTLDLGSDRPLQGQLRGFVGA